MSLGSKFCGVFAASKYVTLFRGDRHFVHVGVGPCFLLHMCTWTPQATSRESLRVLYGAVEYPWMMWSSPVSLDLQSMVMQIVLLVWVVAWFCAFMILGRPA